MWCRLYHDIILHGNARVPVILYATTHVYFEVCACYNQAVYNDMYMYMCKALYALIDVM